MNSLMKSKTRIVEKPAGMTANQAAKLAHKVESKMDEVGPSRKGRK